MSRFTRTKRGGKKRGKDAPPPPPPPVESHQKVVDRLESWTSGVSPMPAPESKLRRIEAAYLARFPGVRAWKPEPGTFHLGGGWSAKPDLLVLDASGTLELAFLSDRMSDQTIAEASALAAIHPWFRVRCIGPGGVPYQTLRNYKVEPPKRRTGDIREGMSPPEREHADRLDDWIKRGWIGGWLYEPVSWRLGGRRHYTPDFLVYGVEGGRVDGIVWQEVKGHMPRPDAEIKLAMFPVLYPFFRVELVQKKRDPGERTESWHHSQVPPGQPFGFS